MTESKSPLKAFYEKTQASPSALEQIWDSKWPLTLKCSHVIRHHGPVTAVEVQTRICALDDNPDIAESSVEKAISEVVNKPLGSLLKRLLTKEGKAQYALTDPAHEVLTGDDLAELTQERGAIRLRDLYELHPCLEEGADRLEPTNSIQSESGEFEDLDDRFVELLPDGATQSAGIDLTASKPAPTPKSASTSEPAPTPEPAILDVSESKQLIPEKVTVKIKFSKLVFDFNFNFNFNFKDQ